MTRSISIPVDKMLRFMGATRRRLEIENTRVKMESLEAGEFLGPDRALPFAKENISFEEKQLFEPIVENMFLLKPHVEVKKPLAHEQRIALNILDNAARETGFYVKESEQNGKDNPVLFLSIEKNKNTEELFDFKEIKALPPHSQSTFSFSDFFQKKEHEYVNKKGTKEQ